MKHRQRWILLSVLFAGSAWSADATKCLEIEDPTTRLVCYDAAHGRGGRTAPADKAASAANAAAPATPEAPAVHDEFGKEDRLQREKSHAAVAAAPAEITGTIVEATRDARGYFTLTLDNGQRWRLMESALHLSFEAGDRVTISRGALGSFLLRDVKGGAARRAKRID